MKNKLILLIIALSVLPYQAFAQTDCPMFDMMSGYGMMGVYGIGLLGLVYFAIASFIFAIIFWYTYKWIIQQKKR